MAALLRLLAARPTEARVLALEAPKLRPAEGSEATRGGAKALEELVERLLFIDRPVPPRPEELSLAAGAVAQVIRADVAAGRLDALPGRLAELEGALESVLGESSLGRGATQRPVARIRPAPRHAA